jgi:glycosyltransferase involved in cell wall biosynthesis
MKISFSATNPCHMHGMAAAIAEQGVAGSYYSGYPEWKLGPAPGLAVRAHSLRTNIVYGLLKYVPERWRPPSRALFRWQDTGFDHWVGRSLERCDFIHGIPGQCRWTFESARRQGIATVLNHATGPVRQWVQIMEPEYRRVGLRLEDYCPYDEAYFAGERREYELAEWHCAASSVVKAQLIDEGISPERIWQVPYGADQTLFHRAREPLPSKEGFRLVFAGQLGLRKGAKTLLESLSLIGRPDWRLGCYGAVLEEAKHDLAQYHGAVPLDFHGAVPQKSLAEAFRAGSVLVLPSLEEGFGLVVPQALSCGLPVIVSDRVGAKDLVRHRENGSIFPVGDAAALAEELSWWEKNWRPATEEFTWKGPASTLIACSKGSLT